MFTNKIITQEHGTIIIAFHKNRQTFTVEKNEMEKNFKAWTLNT